VGYCRERGVEFRADEMNEDERFARVRVRRQLVPLLETFNPRAVEALARAAGARPQDLLAAVGPAIGPCCFEVATDLAARFRDELGARVATARARGARVDLFLANEIVLREAGLDPAHIDVLGRCTSCEADLFFSHRRDHGRSGRQVGFIAPSRTVYSLT
jgi:copper oxidase (laccase) domain-containing protein